MTEDLSTKPLNFIHFHGLNLLAVEHQGVAYIPAKPLCDLANMDWKRANDTIQSSDNAILYGAKRLKPPQIDGLRGHKPPKESVLYIRLDRSRMFLARVSTERMRANGNHLGADQILELQLEWAEALHRYETEGMAFKTSRISSLKDLNALIRSRSVVNDPSEHAALTGLIRQQLIALGIPAESLESPQKGFEFGAAP